MPRDIHTTVYRYEELSDAAKEKAVEAIREKMAGPWWDSADNEQVGDSIVYTLAEKLRTPGWDRYGEGDFPGIPHLSIEGWDLDRGWTLVVDGYVTPDTAPALPWNGAVSLHIGPRGHLSTEVGLGHEGSTEALEQAWKDACHDALVAGRDQYEYMTSEEYAREWLENNDSNEFTEDGDLA